MLDLIIKLSLRHRAIVLAVAAILLALGGRVIAQLPVDVFPDLNRPTVTVMTEAEGYAPEEVETQVTRPLETALAGVGGVTRVRSTSGIGLSIVYVEFDWATDLLVGRQLVAEKLAAARSSLPPGTTPAMGPITSIMGEIMLVGLTAENVPPPELRALADWVVRPRFMAIPGIAQVIAIGGGVKQYQVEVDPNLLVDHGVTFDEVKGAAADATTRNTTGGYAEDAHQEYLIRNLGRVAGIADLAAVPVRVVDGAPLTLDQVARVSEGVAPMRGDGGVNGRRGVILSIQKQPGANTVALTQSLEESLAELHTALPAGVKISPLFRQATFIEAAVANVAEALRDGAILVTIVLFLFLLNFRTTAITLTAIPLSFVITALVLNAFGISINTMTLGGLAVAVGELVDDAIVDVENVFRRLRENRLLAEPQPALTVIFRASSEIRNSIVYATIIVIVAFMPLFALGGIEGRMFAPLGIAYVTSILASLLVSLTVTPVLCSLLLPKARAMERTGDGPLVRWLKAVDRSLVERALKKPGPVLAAAGVAVALAGATIPFMGRDFLPPFNEGTATISLLMQPGTSLTESNRIGMLAESQLLTVPEVASTGRRTGRAEQDEHAEGVHSTEIDVDLVAKGRARDLVLADIRARLGEIPGIWVNIGQPISHRLDHLLSGVRAQIALKIFGPDLDKLRTLAGSAEGALRGIPGLVDLQTERIVPIPQIQIVPNLSRAAVYGVRGGELAAWLETAFHGEVVGQIYERDRAVDMVVRLPAATRQEPKAMAQVMVDTPVGLKIPLGDLADVRVTQGPNQINRENGQRRIVVAANAAGRDLAAVVADVRQALAAKVVVPEGYHLELSGQFESQVSATRTIAGLTVVSLVAILLVLYMHFGSWALAFQVMLNVPLALIGSVVAVYLTGGTMSVATLVGFVTLCGIASRNGIMMISHYLHLMQHEGEGFTPQMIIRGSLERLVPVLMTALTAALALVPLALASGQPGKEILHPVAVVILGGLVSSTLLDMIVTPVAFWTFGEKAARRALAYMQQRTDS